MSALRAELFGMSALRAELFGMSTLRAELFWLSVWASVLLSFELNSPIPKICLFLASGLGIGYIPVAPGTFGSLWGLLLAWGLDCTPWPVRLLTGVLFFIVGVPLCSSAARTLAREDPGLVVWDEIAAFPWVFLLVPWNLWTAVAGFALFRLFDITKPWPARRLEMWPSGWGIMADDLAAGLYAGGVLTGLHWLQIFPQTTG